MKKMIAMTLVLCMAVSLLAGCGSSKQPETTQPSEAAVPASALEILETVWGKYTEDEKFSISGGNVESNVSDAPGSYDMTYAENMTYDLLVPADQIQNITEAASMTHMMNANSFTCGVFKLAEGVTAGDFGKVMQSAIQENHWMCGFPDTLLIQEISGTYVLVAFGLDDLIATLGTHVAEAYPQAVTLANEPVEA